MIDTSQICSYSSSPFGKLLLTSDGDALTGVYLTGYHAIVPQQVQGDRKHPLLRETDRQLQAYFAGKLRAFDLPLHMPGTPFQELVWNGLRDIPFGTTMSYGELARNIGRSSASRAVGAANGRNPISIIVPCHRVIGANGTLVGYGGGLDRKAWLLRHEAKILGSIH